MSYRHRYQQRLSMNLIKCFFVISLFSRKQQFESALLINTWKVKWEDVEPLRSGKGGKDGSTVRMRFGD